MPEGDTLARIAAGLRPVLQGHVVTAARARTPGPRVDRIVGRRALDVRSVGKNLLIGFENGLELRTHLRLQGTWHRYRRGERWRRAPGRAVLVLETAAGIAVCFDAPVVELFETRAEGLNPALAGLGPDLLDPAFDAAEAIRRLRAVGRRALEIGPALLDQRALAGIGNVYKSEILFIERIDPSTRVGELDDEALGRVVERARALLVANATRARGPERVTTGDPGVARGGFGGPLWVYRRAGRPCRRCGTPIRVAWQGDELPRRTYWCPSCQARPGRVDGARARLGSRVRGPGS